LHFKMGRLGGVEIEALVVDWQARALGKDWFKNDYNYLVMLKRW